MKNFIQHGDALVVAAPYAVASGAGLLVGIIFGVASAAADNGAPVAIVTEGVFSLKTKSTDTPAQGAAAYWDNTNKELTTTATDNTKVGAFTEAKLNGATVGTVRLNGAF